MFGELAFGLRKSSFSQASNLPHPGFHKRWSPQVHGRGDIRPGQAFFEKKAHALQLEELFFRDLFVYRVG